MNYTTAAQLQADERDEERTKRQFVGLVASALGVDQSYLSDDARASSMLPDRYIIANPDGTFSTLGQPASNVQRATEPAAAGITITPGLLLIIGAALLLLR